LPEVPQWWGDAAALEAKQNNSTGAYYIGHVIWKQFRLRGTKSGLALPAAMLRKLGFGRRYVSTAINVLEAAGLIQVTRFNYKLPMITLITDEEAAARLRKSYGFKKTKNA
jgi:hypothetical protein